MAYDIDSDPDLNAFETDDLKDLTMSGMGTASREFVTLEEFIISFLIFLFILGIVAFFLNSITVFFLKRNRVK